MAPKAKGKGEPGGLIDEDTLAECKRLQSLAYEGVSEGMPLQPQRVAHSTAESCCAPRCCPSPAGSSARRPHPAKVRLCRMQAPHMHRQPDLCNPAGSAHQGRRQGYPEEELRAKGQVCGRPGMQRLFQHAGMVCGDSSCCMRRYLLNINAQLAAAAAGRMVRGSCTCCSHPSSMLHV